MALYKDWIKDRLTGQEVHIVASGSSLESFDYSVLDNKNTIATNNAYKKLKNPLWTVSVDQMFIRKEDSEAPYKTNLISRPLAGYPIIEMEFSDRFTMIPEEGVYNKKSSGAAAISTALQAGASKIYLYGFDCYISKDKVHATDNEFAHRKKVLPNMTKKELQALSDIYENMIFHFRYFPTDRIVNMNINSGIPFFKKINGY